MYVQFPVRYSMRFAGCGAVIGCAHASGGRVSDRRGRSRSHYRRSVDSAGSRRTSSVCSAFAQAVSRGLVILLATRHQRRMAKATSTNVRLSCINVNFIAKDAKTRHQWPATCMCGSRQPFLRLRRWRWTHIAVHLLNGSVGCFPVARHVGTDMSALVGAV